MSIVARRYAQALMNLAEGENQVQDVAESLDGFADLLRDAPDLSAFLAEPKVPQSGKEAAVGELLEKTVVSPLVNTFVRYITRKRRIALLEDIRRIYHELADERMGRASADVTVAVELPADQQERLRSRLEHLSGKQVALRVQTDPAILGGVIARIGSTVWDGSLRNQLNQIQQSMIED